MTLDPIPADREHENSVTAKSPALASAIKPNSMDAAAGPEATWGAVWMLIWREWTRFFRQRNRVVGALVQPILFWLLFGTGMHGSFRTADGQDFMGYYLPGTVTLILLFTAIFATISIIEDRREGFLQNVLAAPVPRWTIAAGKIIGGAAIAWAQALLFVGLTVLIGSVPFDLNLFPLMGMMAMAAAAMTALGVFFAWPMESTQGFHAIMNLVLMPLWLLSGAFFPIPLLDAESTFGQVAMHWVMRLNPVSYCVGGMRQMMLPSVPGALQGYWAPSLQESWAAAGLFLIVTCTAAWWMVARRGRGV